MVHKSTNSVLFVILIMSEKNPCRDVSNPKSESTLKSQCATNDTNSQKSYSHTDR